MPFSSLNRLTTAACLLACCLAACGESEPESVDDNAERAFLEALIPSHEYTLRLAEEAQGRGEHPEVRTLASEIAAARRQELVELQRSGPSRDELGLGPPPGPTGLSPTAAPYDRLFLDSLILAAQNTIGVARAAQTGVDDPGPITLARRVFTGQVCEIRELNRLRTRLYGLPLSGGEVPLGRRRLQSVYRRCAPTAEPGLSR